MPDPELLRNPGEPACPYAYLRIRNFGGSTPSILEDSLLRQIGEVLARFDEEAPGGLILDIRGRTHVTSIVVTHRIRGWKK